MDKLNLAAWTGNVITEVGEISVQLANQIIATLGDSRPNDAKDKAHLSPLWHWCAFPTTTAGAQLGRDGHPSLGSFMPPLHFRRRMWAGGALRFHAPLHIGEALMRRTTLRSIVEKEGQTGPMVFVTLDHSIYGDAGLAIEERQDIVYLDIPPHYRAPKPIQMPSKGEIMVAVDTPETLLFRYSALTFNAHRIHYDKDYAQRVEHYPGLVVHGPLQATLLMQAAITHKGRAPSDFHFRGVHPMFSDHNLDIVGVVQDGGLEICTGQLGHQGMKATVLWEDTV